MTIDLQPLEIWFVTGSQHLYGEATLQQVAEHSQIIARALSEATEILADMPDSVSTDLRGIVTTLTAVLLEALVDTAGPAEAAGVQVEFGGELPTVLKERSEGPGEMIGGFSCRLDENARMPLPLVLVTDYPDETLSGEAFIAAHEAQRAATIAAYEAFQDLDSWDWPLA